MNKKSVVSPKPTADSVEIYRKYVIMCVSNEQCRMKVEKRAVLAQSAFRRLHTIGRMPDSGKAKLSHCTANKPVRSGKKRAVLAQRLEENYDRNLLREVI